jgi:hypothetical protein
VVWAIAIVLPDGDRFNEIVAASKVSSLVKQFLSATSWLLMFRLYSSVLLFVKIFLENILLYTEKTVSER